VIHIIGTRVVIRRSFSLHTPLMHESDLSRAGHAAALRRSFPERKHMKKLLIAVALAFSSFPVVADARPNDDRLVTASIDVFYGDLNLDHAAGAAVMLNRIKSAAVRVCGGAPHGLDLKGQRDFRACVADATNDAVRQLNAPLVTALHTGRNAGPRVAGR